MRPILPGLAAALLLAACGPDPPAAGIQESGVTEAVPSGGAADSLYQAGAFTEARGAWEADLLRARQAGDSTGAAEILTSLGLVSRRLGEYPEARRFGEEGLALKLRLGMVDGLFRSYNALGLTAEDEGRLEDAASLFGLAAEAAAAVGDSLDVAKAAFNMARVHQERGEPGPAREGFELLRRAASAAGDTLLWGRALINLGLLDLRDGNPLPAVASLESAREMARAVEDVEAEENALGQLATAYLLLGEPQRAFAALDTALALARQHEMPRQVGEDLWLLGNLYALAGDHRRALGHYGQAEEAWDGIGLVEEAGNLLRAQAASFRALGTLDSARVRVERARVLHAESGFRESEFLDLLLLAEIEADADRRGEATERLRGADGAARALETKLPMARWALVAARLWDRWGEPDSVLAVLEGADEVLPRLGTADGWEPDALRARAWARIGRLEAAEAAGRRAVASVERLRMGFGAPDLRASLVSARSDVYADLVVTLVRQGRMEDAFEVADAARGRALLEHLGAARSELAARGGEAADLLRARDVLRRMDALLSRLVSGGAREGMDRGGAGSSEDDLRRELDEAGREYEALLQRLARAPEAVVLGAHTARTPEVRAALREDEVLVEYLTSSERTEIFALTRNGVAHASVPAGSEDLSSRVRLAVDLLSRPTGGRHAGHVLRSLHETLVAPLDSLGVLGAGTRIVVVPHGPLAYLPFAALTDAGGTMLVERHSLLFLSSASALPALRGRSAPAEASGGAVLAPFPRDLPATRGEARNVAEALGLRGERIHVGSGATEAALRAGLSAPGVVHVATHGVMNAWSPMFTRLDLAPGGGSDGQDDGRLEVREILAMEVASSLVYLSGCETGRAGSWSNPFARGEDYATLAQAFLYAGAENVVATLWRISDPAAAALAGRFYESLRTADPVEALASAQRALLRDPRFDAPYYWAAYQITGAGWAPDRKPSPPGPSN